MPPLAAPPPPATPLPAAASLPPVVLEASRARISISITSRARSGSRGRAPSSPNPTVSPLPPDEDKDVDVVKVMGDVVKEVHRGLPLLLKEAGLYTAELPLHEHPPLEIKSTIAKSDLSSYKEPWRRSRAVTDVVRWQRFVAARRLPPAHRQRGQAARAVPAAKHLKHRHSFQN